LRKGEIGRCGAAKSNLRSFLEVFSRINKKTKLDFHFKFGVILNNVAVIIWMDSAPVKIMSTIHKVTRDKSEVLRMRKHPGKKKY
jgi:hypothetical protein